MKISPPTFESLNAYYQKYWELLSEDDLFDALQKQTRDTFSFLKEVPGDREDYAYAVGKWMLKEVIGHVADTERILSYRALCFARNDKTVLPGFDENGYMEESLYRTFPLSEIITEWQSVRSATLSLYSHVNDKVLDNIGIANNVSVSPRIILYFILVHERHHIRLIKNRYLSS